MKKIIRYLYGCFVCWAIVVVVTGVTVYAQSVVINELMASNGSVIADEDGDYGDWIELLNRGTISVQLDGYGLSDDESNPFRWTFPAISIEPGEFLLVWATGKNRAAAGGELHTNFSIDSDGERITLVRPDGILADEVPPVLIPRDVSYGREPDGYGTWHYFTDPTPADSNTAEAYHGLLDPPIFSHEAGVYTGAFDLTIESAVEEADIYYTIDGSEPHETSLYYSGPVAIDDRNDISNDISEIPTSRNFNWRSPGGPVQKVNVIRARAFREGYVPSESITHTYLVDHRGTGRYTLPVISLVTHRDNFFDNEIGIYVPGVNYIPDPLYPWAQEGNFTQRGEEWERTVHLEYFSEDGVREFHQYAGVRIHGGATRSFPQKSLRLYARNRYGDEWFEYPFFIDKDLPRVRRFILRNSGNDWDHTMFRDVLLQQLVRDLDLDYQAFRPVIVFLNGEYWGIHNLRERIDRYYLETNYSLDPESIDLLTRNMVVREGDDTHFRNLISFLSENDLTDTENFAYVESQMEIQNFIDYTISQIYFRNTDWPANNIDYWRPRAVDGKWRWILYDTDFGFGLIGGPGAYLHDTLEHAAGEENDDDTAGSRLTLILRALLTNPEFRERFILRFADIINSTFEPERVANMIDFFRNMYDPEIAEHQHRWYPHQSYDTWDRRIDIMRTFAERRPGAVRGHITEYFNLDGIYPLTIEINYPHAGTVRVNSILLDGDSFTYNDSLDGNVWKGVYFNNLPVTLIAEAYPGYVFHGWGKGYGGGDTLHIMPADSTHITARFIREGEFHDDPMNPEPYDLSQGPFRFNYWPDHKSEGSFPPNMVFQQTDISDPGLDDEMTHTYQIPEDEYHSDDEENTSFPYRLTRRTRITAWGSSGITFVNTGRNRDLGAAVLALNTTGLDSVMVSWTAGTILPNSRVYALRLQYRVGSGGPFKDVHDISGDPVEYIRHETGQHFQFIEPVLVPDEVNDQPYVQIRWKYYHVHGTSGPRAKLLLDNILVTSGRHPHTLLPEPHDLNNGSYHFSYWDPAEPEGVFPDNMVLLQARTDDPLLEDEMIEPYHIPFLDIENNEYHEDDREIIGYPYMLTGRTRFSGLGEGGIAFINTGRGRDIGAVVLALQTTGHESIAVSWAGGTIVPSSRAYAIRLQYRVGTSGPFRDLMVNGNPVEYERTDIPGHEETLDYVVLPADANNQPYIQLKWRYYYTGERLDPFSGQRDMLRIGNIVVSATPTGSDDTAGHEFPENYFLRQNFPNPFNPSTVITYGLPERSSVRITVYSVLGREITTLVDEEQQAGTYEIRWAIPQHGLASGVYYYRIEATGLEPGGERFVQTKSMVVIQ